MNNMNFNDKLIAIYSIDIDIKIIAKKVYIILINEIIPRAKRLKLSISEFIDGWLVNLLARLEILNYITRHKLRKFLDDISEQHKENRI